jgi:hypothetical protein
MSIALVLLLGTSCKPGYETQKDFRSEVQWIYQGLMEQYGQYDPKDPAASQWTFSYHPMIHAAWIYKSRLRVSRRIESQLRQGNDILWRLDGDLKAQVAEGATSLDRDRFLALIEDDGIRSRTLELMDSGIPSLNAFARAFIEPVAEGSQDLPEMILRLLGKAYAARPEICELPAAGPIEDADTRWRDWLHISLAASGKAGTSAVIDWDDQIDDLQDLVPDHDFWDGRLSHAYSLRTLQLAKGEAVDRILEELAGYREGGEVAGFHGWMYWDLAWSVGSDGSMYPYSEEQVARVSEFLIGGLTDGPLGEGQEARVVADALGRAPSAGFFDRLVEFATNENLPCERRQVGYLGLATMLRAPLGRWADGSAGKDEYRRKSVAVVEKGGLLCGNVPLLEFYASLMTAFGPSEAASPDEKLTDEQMLGIHQAFVELLPELKTADERGLALDLLLWALVQPDFMIHHPELSHYRDIFLGICDDWMETTVFEGSVITGEDLERLITLFRHTLGEGSVWENE